MIDSGARGFIGVLIVLVVAGACSSSRTPNEWIDDGVHAVDGYWILAEHPCDLASTDPCTLAVRAAAAKMDVDPTTVVRGATAAVPKRWVRWNGEVVMVLSNSSGTPPEFVVLDLADGSRRAIGFGCLAVPGPEGSPVCLAFRLDQYRVGSTPFD